jgi:hypothetical protein
MRNPPGWFARVCSGCGSARSGGGGSVRRRLPACTRSGCSGLGTFANRGSVRARCRGKPGTRHARPCRGSPRRLVDLRGGGAPASSGPSAVGD